MVVSTGITGNYSISARVVGNLRKCFTVFNFHVVRDPEKEYDEEFVGDIKSRFESLIPIPFVPEGIREMTNSEKDGHQNPLPYSSFVRISNQNEILGIYFEESFKDEPFVFIHYKPESGRIVLSNFLDIEKAAVLQNDMLLDSISEELRNPNKISQMLAGIEDIEKLSKTFSAISNYYIQRKEEYFEVELDYKL